MRMFLCVFLGLLTVDPKQRLTMQELRSSEWLQGTQVFSLTPLVTPDVLSLNPSTVVSVRTQLNVINDAFHKAHREGFRLQDVTKAPLAKRRKMKKSSTDTRSSSSDSSASHGSTTPTKGLTQSPMRNSPVRNLSNNSQSSTTSTGFTPMGATLAAGKQPPGLDSSGFFSFKEARIAALMPTIPQDNEISTISSSSSTQVPSSGSNGHLQKDRKQESSARGAKRKIDYDDDDDDCVIIGEEVAPGVQQTDTINNNNAKRPRSDTIVIE